MILSARRAARRSLALAAALALTATLSATAYAEDPETPATGTSTTESVPTTTTSVPPVESPPGDSQPSESKPAESKPTETPAAPAAAAELTISATVAGGPYLVGQRIPVEVTIANNGDTDATAVKAGVHTLSGSAFFIPNAEWGELDTSWGDGVTVPAGQELVVTVRGDVQQWNGVPVSRFHVQQGSTRAEPFDLTLPVRAPDSATDTVAGLVYGDRDGNGAPDPGEALAGIDVRLSWEGQRLNAKTDAEGRFRFADLPVRVYSLYISNAPDGWVLENSFSEVTADGHGASANLVRRGVRPLTDRLSAAMRFTKELYNVGERAEIQVTLTNKSATDVTGIRGHCGPIGGGWPELVDVDTGDLVWNGPGVTVPAGQSRVFTVSGTMPPKSAEYGGIAYPCSFGPEYYGEGNPLAYAFARVPAPPGDLRFAFYHDRDGDQYADAHEMLPDVAIGLKDMVTGNVVAKGRTDAKGRVVFQNLPAGPYQVRVYGPWAIRDPGPWFAFAGRCRHCQLDATIALVPGPEVPEEDVVTVVPPVVPPAEPPAVPPAGEGSSAGPAATAGGGLAQTGASVLGLIAMGVLALAGGFGALVVARKRAS